MKKILGILLVAMFLVAPIAFAEDAVETTTNDSTVLVEDTAAETTGKVPTETAETTEVTATADQEIVATEENSDNLSETESQEITETIDAAETTETQEETTVTPDMPIRWGLKRISEKIDLFLTFNKTKQADKKLAFAERRLQEMKKMSEKKNIKALAKAQRAHADLISELAEDEESLADEDVSAAEKVESELQKHIQVLEGVKAKLEAKGVQTKGVENALVKSRYALDKFQNMNETRKEKLAGKIVGKAEKINTRKEARKGQESTEESSETEVEDSEDEEETNETEEIETEEETEVEGNETQ